MSLQCHVYSLLRPPDIHMPKFLWVLIYRYLTTNDLFHKHVYHSRYIFCRTTTYDFRLFAFGLFVLSYWCVQFYALWILITCPFHCHQYFLSFIACLFSLTLCRKRCSFQWNQIYPLTICIFYVFERNSSLPWGHNDTLPHFLPTGWQFHLSQSCL